MTQKQIEQTRVIALYDKWLVIPEGTYAECHRQTIWFGHGGKFDCYHDITAVSDMPYLTDLNALHKVAMDVTQELRKEKKELNQFETEYLIGSIRLGMFSIPINGQYIDLFNAVYDGCLFLNQYKITP